MTVRGTDANMEKAFSIGFAGSSWKGPRRHDYRPDLLWLVLILQNKITPLLSVGTRVVDVENESLRCEIPVGTSRAQWTQCPNNAVTAEVGTSVLSRKFLTIPLGGLVLQLQRNFRPLNGSLAPEGKMRWSVISGTSH
jgi:hypothetical protein